ncbi:MAG: zinc ribbon domain-containing protein [Eubacteriaceae bacterium]|nr:zinc ribbon domain-containing protein [Eubacteriaceae bacterium]
MMESAAHCEHCGAYMREGANFCPECGLARSAAMPAPGEYSYETASSLYSRKAIIAIILLAWLPMTGIGLLVALAEGFWFVPVIMGGIVALAVYIITWAYKGKQKKWGVERTLWVIAREGYACSYPPDVAKRLAMLGMASVAATSGKANPSVVSHGIKMAKNAGTLMHGMPINPWGDYISAEYRPEKLEIALHKPSGQTALIYANNGNYEHVEQLVRMYMAGSRNSY